MSTRYEFPTLLAAAALIVFAGRPADAQAIVVQQPVVQQFGVNTVVSVPDRGSALLGSVGAAESFARSYGPLGVGTNVSRSVRASGLSVHVTIHDFDAMDVARLAAGQRIGTGDPLLGDRAVLSGPAANACDQLLKQHRDIVRQPRTPPRSLTSPGLAADHAAAGSSAANRLGSRSFR